MIDQLKESRNINIPPCSSKSLNAPVAYSYKVPSITPGASGELFFHYRQLHVGRSYFGMTHLDVQVNIILAAWLQWAVFTMTLVVLICHYAV